MAAIFFIIWGTVYEQKSVQVDTVVFNSIFILINIGQSIPLLKQIWHVKLTPIESIIFNRNFINFMNIRQFKHFIDHFKSDTYRANHCNIVSRGQNFRGLYYIAMISEGLEVHLKSEGNSFKILEEGNWAGIVENYEYESKKYSKKEVEVLWDITLEVIHSNSNEIISDEEYLNRSVIVYFFDLKVQIN